ncbi:protein NRT1/ PTR FAMILY 1.2 isoform X1 [Diospyros lotus]|uniref:protein NRT1/ PTR FAMILY 1.2 isoform X1 n=1 Tax=Diospyros lotus TaxID=55363 RepID=UPI0022537D81|nr:protein NRT1/ PTR FAMILY 1.2 isoform X1 [Diospyros lotus]
METPSDEKMMSMEPLLEASQSQKGGFRTMPFIIANEAFEKVASYGLAPNMILYLMNEYHMDMATGSNLLFFWSAATNFLPVLGAVIADSSVGRFRMIGFGSIVSLLGMILLWLTTVVPQARPPPCDHSNNSCSPPTTFQIILLCSSFGLMSVGAGGIRSSSLAFGADQLKKHDNLKNASALERYFSWYYVSASFSVLIAMTCIVYIQEKVGWEVGFGVPALLMFSSAVSFFLASPFYIKLKAKSSLLTGFAQVIVASYRNRHLTLSSEGTELWYHYRRGSILVAPSEKLRFLNKACIIRDPQQDTTSEGRSSDPWSLCTVDQVEELKALIKIIPLWSTGIMISVTISQSSFPVLQAMSMDRHITSGFEIPAGSFGMFLVISLTLWIALYDRLILPLASKIMGNPVYLSSKHRMGIGLFFSFAAMAVTAIVESIRRAIAVSEGFADKSQAMVNMSALWLIPQYCLSGLAEAFNAIGQNEFYYSEFPRSMSSIASNLNSVGMSIANVVASFIMSTINDVTGRGGKESWISSNINKGHFDYYFWLLAGLSLVNIMYFCVCSRAYGPCVVERRRDWDEGDDEIAAE